METETQGPDAADLLARFAAELAASDGLAYYLRTRSAASLGEVERS